jgi:hypothetical protein
MADSQPPAPRAFEDYPLTRIEPITTFTHHYRGERSRADAWQITFLQAVASPKRASVDEVRGFELQLEQRKS